MSALTRLTAIRFAEPGWLAVGLVATVAVILLGARLARKRRAVVASFASRRGGQLSSVSPARRGAKRVLVALGVALGFAALARPQLGYREEEVHRQGIDLVFAIDTSKSMLAADVKPSRIARARLAVADLTAKFEGDRVGLVAFAGDAFLQCPLTLDRGMFEQTLQAIDVGIIPRGGTDVGRAIDTAKAALASEPVNQKILVLLTDGEDLEARAVEAAKQAHEAGIRVFTIGVGGEAGEIIPLHDESGAAIGFLKDDTGAYVRSRLDDKTLREIAAAGGGEYRALGADGRGLDALYLDVLAKLPRETVGSRMRRVPIERFAWPLAASLLCLSIEALLGERRRRTRAARAERKRASATPGLAMAAAIGAILLFTAGRAGASPGSAQDAYRAGKFAEAAADYRGAAAKSPNDARLHFNLGAADYRSGDLTDAQAAFEKAANGDRAELHPRAYYDLGNTLYRAGQKTLEAKPDQTIAEWNKAIDSYESALKLDSKDGDAAFNRDFVKRKLAELEQRQKEQKEQDKDKEQDQKQQDKSQQSKNDQDKGKPDKDKPGQSQPGKGQKDQQSQNQSGGQKDKDNKDQQGQGQPDKAQQDKAQQAKNQQGQGPQDKAQQAQNQQGQGQQDKARQDKAQPGQPGAAEGTEGNPVADRTAKPGELSKDEARMLLDALRGDERLLPATPSGANASADDQPVKKDW